MEDSLKELKVLKSRSTKRAKVILRNPSYSLVRAISEICHNINLGNVNLRDKRKYSRILSKLGSSKVSSAEKKAILKRAKPEVVRKIVAAVKWLDGWPSSRRRISSRG